MFGAVGIQRSHDIVDVKPAAEQVVLTVLDRLPRLIT
jgi:hypothetical protein